MIVLFSVLIILSTKIYAKNHEVKLLTSGDNGQTMLMSPGYLKISKGDTVTFLPSDASHNIQSVSIPKKVKAFASQMGQKFSYTFDEKGVYLYKCTPHFALGMLGVIQVDNTENLAQVRKDWSGISTGVVMNKERVGEYLSQVK